MTNNLQNNAVEIEEPSPEVIALRKDLAKKYQVHLIEQKKQQMKEFEIFKSNVDRFANKLNRMKVKFYDMFNSPDLITDIEKSTKAVNQIIVDMHKIFSANELDCKHELELLKKCLNYLSNLLNNQNFSDEYDVSPANFSFNHYVTPLVNNFLEVSQSINAHYNSCMSALLAYLPQCKLAKDKSIDAGYYEKSRTYEIDNNNCVRSITVNKFKNNDWWSVELRALKTNADPKNEMLYLSNELNQKLAEALNANGLPVTTPGVEYFPDKIDRRARVFKINGTLDQINNLWPQILFTVIQVEGDNVYSSVPHITHLLDTMAAEKVVVQQPVVKNANKTDNTNVFFGRGPESDNNDYYFGRGPQPHNHPFWTNKTPGLNNQMESMSLNENNKKPQRS